jgi:hypothetical protein
MFVKTTNDQIDQYPYTVGDLRRDNPNTSFPKRVSDEMLADWGVYPVAKADRPNVGHTQNLTEGQPALVDGQWQQTWVITDATPEEVSQRAAQQADDIRNTRNQLLSDSDWTQIGDAPVNATAWATYRQALRDITDHANFPYLGDDDWPVEPA